MGAGRDGAIPAGWKRTRSASTLVASVLLALAGAACGAGESGAAAGRGSAEPVETTVVEMPRHYRFAPEAIRVRAGSTVTWRNTDDFTHSVRLETGDGTVHMVPPGDSTRITFDAPGTYPYTCTLHPHDMSGVVIVTP
ncbi:MAG TPA: cupredoxin domain-containing protein [Longimicrobiales bacterium]